MKNIEIEIKIKINKQKFDNLEEYLINNGKHINSSHETDQYFNLQHRDFLSPEYPYEWLRLREKNNKNILNYKHWYPKNSSISTHCDEFETEIKDTNALVSILKALNAVSLVKVDKFRKKYIFQKDFEICLDYIEDLGYFIELEFVGDIKTIDEARAKIDNLIKTFDLNIEQKDNRGYPYLMLEKAGKL